LFKVRFEKGGTIIRNIHQHDIFVLPSLSLFIGMIDRNVDSLFTGNGNSCDGWGFG